MFFCETEVFDKAEPQHCAKFWQTAHFWCYWSHWVLSFMKIFRASVSSSFECSWAERFSTRFRLSQCTCDHDFPQWPAQCHQAKTHGSTNCVERDALWRCWGLQSHMICGSIVSVVFDGRNAHGIVAKRFSWTWRLLFFYSNLNSSHFLIFPAFYYTCAYLTNVRMHLGRQIRELALKLRNAEGTCNAWWNANVDSVLMS